jgi:hypothetical protein
MDRSIAMNAVLRCARIIRHHPYRETDPTVMDIMAQDRLWAGDARSYPLVRCQVD